MIQIKVVPFLNPFVKPRRIEILIDWQQDWSGESLDGVTQFDLGIADEADDSPTRLLTLDRPTIIPEIAEQLFPLFPSVPDLAPKFVEEMRRRVSRPDNGTSPQAVPSKPALFMSPHPTADLERWYRDPSLMMQAFSNDASSRPTVRSAIDQLLDRPQQQGIAKLDTSQVPDEVRNPAMLLKVVEAAERSRRDDVKALREAIQTAALQDQLTYAEALRREAIYRRRREGVNDQPMISSSADDEAALMKHRADLRRIARDEPVIGAMFRAVYSFEWPDDLDSMLVKDKYLFAWPLPKSDRFQPGATRIGFDTASRWVSVLRRDGGTESYFAHGLQVRQISPALLLDEEHDDEGDCPTHEPPSLTRMLQTKHVLPPVDHHIADVDHPMRPLVDDAFTRNDVAYLPKSEPVPGEGVGGSQADDVTKDRERELTDAAESMRRHHPPFDAIGITWERDSADKAFNEDKPKFQNGYKGYRIDVRENGGDWESLCMVERAALGPQGEEIFRARLAREGYVFQAVQNHSPANDKMRLFTVPSDFVHWAGGSVIVSAALDRLGQALPRTEEEEHPLIALREAGKTRIHPRYGRTYEFRARGVGLTGVGPLVTEATSKDASVDSVEFLRGIPMSAPDALVEYVDLVPVDPEGKPISLPETPDIPMQVTGSDPRVNVRTLLPITHWRVALHARGVKEEEREQRGGVEFENVCARFVARSRDRWRRRSPEELRNGAHLSAVDPDCAGIELVSKVWFPFSSNESSDRHLITGKTRIGHREIGEATFSELVVMGENIVEELDQRRDELRVPVVSDLLPSRDVDGRARLLAGFHSLLEVGGIWSKSAKKYDTTQQRLWTRQLSMRSGPARAIGGRITAVTDMLQAGLNQPLIVQPWLRAEASYAALATPEMERILSEPDQAPAVTPQTGETCDIRKPSHVRGEVIRWRKSEFEKRCGEFPQDAAALDAYWAFVMAQLGKCVASPQDKSELAFSLLPQIVRAPDDNLKRALVRPVFTFPGEPAYREVAQLPSQHGCVHSMPVKIGDLASFGIARIDIDDAGNGYTAPPVVTFVDPQHAGNHATATAEVKDGKVISIVVVAPGDGYSKQVKVELSGGGGTGAKATAVRKTGHRLPWIDDEITWVVRLAWRIPLEGGPVERPLELSAVREFRLYRRDTRKPDECDTKTQDERRDRKPLAILPRPGVDVLRAIDLDLVEFTWVDAITDRDAHDFEYIVEAVPEDNITFATQDWLALKVIVPDSKIGARPESLRFLPMRSHEGMRRLGLYVSNPEVRKTTDHATYFAALAADDPLLSLEPPVAKAIGAPDVVNPAFADLFPAKRIEVMPVQNWNELRARRPHQDGTSAEPTGVCQSQDEVPRAPVFVIANRGTDGKPLISAAGVLGNPFFRLHVHAFDDERFPALAHTAASDPAESDWLQFYPDALAWKNDGTLSVAEAWGHPTKTSDDNLIWYRWHFFVQATDTMSFHLSTFYSHAPSFDPATQRAALRAAWTRFVSGTVPASVDVLVHAEEGMRAPTYQIGSDGKAVEDPLNKLDYVFVVLRSTADARMVNVTL